ncbi:MAG: Pr6Pr family membrane protein [Candidatus Lokiarchaeota archaeon]|nr:Pr6Pr family membrane protein [Candidatus Lokiarchaeota archaeon]
MKDINLSNNTVLIYRILFAGLSWFTFIASVVIYGLFYGPIFEWFNSFKAFTIQTNFMVTIWLTLAILWHKKPEPLEKITGLLKGAFTVYISITFIFFAILLAPFYHPTGWAAFSNLVFHYITPIAFIVDWLLTENKLRYKWKYLFYWVCIYPVCYLVFIFIHGALTSDYIYYFFDVNALGMLGAAIPVSIIITTGITLACVYIAVNRMRTKS